MSSPRPTNAFGGRAARGSAASSPRDGGAGILHRKEGGINLRSDEWDDGKDDPLEPPSPVKYSDGEPSEKPSPQAAEVNLLDMARQAKEPKGLKDFERVPGPRVIALGDEPKGPAVHEEDWEDIGVESDSRKTYSSIVQDN